MGLGSIRSVAVALIEAGRAEGTPVAVVSRATHRDERVVRGTLSTIAESVDHAKLQSPALIIVGEVVTRAVMSPAMAGVQSRDALERAV
jgi:uroporphyrinogen III methyltransferase/synthase